MHARRFRSWRSDAQGARARLATLSLALSALLCGCVATGGTNVIEDPALPPATGEPVSIERSFESHPGAVARSFIVVRTLPEWQSLWPRGPGGVSAAPKVDFSQWMALVAFGGRKPDAGWSLRIERVVRATGELAVEVRESSPPPGCVLPEGPSHPRHIVLVPRTESAVRFLVRAQQRGTCLQPPEIGLACRVEAPEAFRSLGPVLYPRPGQTVACEASGEGVVAWDWSVLAKPEGSSIDLASEERAAARLQIDRPGSYLIGVQGRTEDGQATRRTVRLETEPPRYEIELEADEPDGAAGLGLLVVPPSGASGPCGSGQRPEWCVFTESGYGARASLAATEQGAFEIVVTRQEGAQPSATVTVRLGERILARASVPSEAQVWSPQGRWSAGRLETAAASFVSAR